MSDEKLDTLGEILFLSFIFSILFFFIIYYFTAPYKETIFDRKNGLITFPGFMWAKNITMRFDDVFLWKIGGFTGSTISGLRLGVVRPDFLGSHTYIGGSYGLYESVAYRVWYMDKNRPLPPGTYFDPYRKKDFERRKAEGFPPPLYPSYIPTPEATPAQQKEREKSWKDEAYMVDAKEAEYNLLDGFKNKA